MQRATVPGLGAGIGRLWDCVCVCVPCGTALMGTGRWLSPYTVLKERDRRGEIISGAEGSRRDREVMLGGKELPICPSLQKASLVPGDAAPCSALFQGNIVHF